MQHTTTAAAHRNARVRTLTPFEWTLLFALSIAFAWAALTSTGSTLSSDASLVPVKVSQGDSLWSIASSHPVDGLSTQQVVDLITDRNSLESSTLAAGEVLLVPSETESDMLAMR